MATEPVPTECGACCHRQFVDRLVEELRYHLAVKQDGRSVLFHENMFLVQQVVASYLDRLTDQAFMGIATFVVLGSRLKPHDVWGGLLSHVSWGKDDDILETVTPVRHVRRLVTALLCGELWLRLAELHNYENLETPELPDMIRAYSRKVFHQVQHD